MNCYHLYCLDPPLTDVPPGIWHCPQCVKRKLLFGVHSVSDGIESVWDVRELEVPNVKGLTCPSIYNIENINIRLNQYMISHAVNSSSIISSYFMVLTCNA